MNRNPSSPCREAGLHHTTSATPTNALKGFVFDIDGILWIGGAAHPTAARLLDHLSAGSRPFCLLTNDCSCAASERAAALGSAGLDLKCHNLLTPAKIAHEWLTSENLTTVYYLGAPGVLNDLRDPPLLVSDQPSVDAVVVGDVFGNYSRASLDRAAQAILQGARFIALQRNRTWDDGTGRAFIDNGFWIAGLEYVTNVQATVMGKPSPVSFGAALRALALSNDEIASVGMVSDDPESDLKGAKEYGFSTIYVGGRSKIPNWIDHAFRDLSDFEHAFLGGT